MLTCGVAWRAVMPPARRVGVVMATAARILRDAGSELLPFSAARRRGHGRPRADAGARVGRSGAFASTVVDMTLEIVAQLAFTALGVVAPVARRLGAAIRHAGADRDWRLQRSPARPASCWRSAPGCSCLLEQLYPALRARATPSAAAMPRGEGVHDAIHECLWPPRRRRRSAPPALRRVAGDIARSLGRACSFLGAAAAARGGAGDRELHLCRSRSAAFFVPSGLGVQEGGYVLLGAIFGLGPETALALSLAKRARELDHRHPRARSCGRRSRRAERGADAHKA